MLTATACNNAKAKEKQYKLSDGGGLYLLVTPHGTKLWRQKYRFAEKEKLLAHGAYPIVSLADARKARDEAKKILAMGMDPGELKKEEHLKTVTAQGQTFELVAREWHANKKDGWGSIYAGEIINRLKADIFPQIGLLPMNSIKSSHVLATIRKIEARGAYEVAKRLLGVVTQIFSYGVITDRCEANPAYALRGALKKVEKGHFAAITIDEIPAFLKKLERNEMRAFPTSLRATKLLMLTLVRTSELIEAPKSEINLETRRWVIPAERMKMKKDHIVPLSDQAVALIKEQIEATGESQWLFPNRHYPVKKGRHLSNNTILHVIDRMGYKGRMTGHGFRSLAMSTIKERLGYRHEVVDRQLAHAPKGVDKAYDRAQFLPERTKMMQEWADYLDQQLLKG